MGKDQIGIKTPEFVSLQFQLAGLGSRAAAVIIDYSILTIVNIVIFFIIYFYDAWRFRIVLLFLT